MFETENSLIDGVARQADPTTDSRSKATQLGCLVVSRNAHRSEFLQDAAGDAGWQASESLDVVAARKQVIRQRLPLVVIDLESETGSCDEQLKDLAEKLSRQRGVMLILCGNEGNAMEEIWARQLGAWLYLPGVTEQSDLTSLYREATAIQSRRVPAPATSGGWTPPAK